MNDLPPKLRAPHCRHSIFESDSEAQLPDAVLPFEKDLPPSFFPLERRRRGCRELPLPRTQQNRSTTSVCETGVRLLDFLLSMQDCVTPIICPTCCPTILFSVIFYVLLRWEAPRLPGGRALPAPRCPFRPTPCRSPMTGPRPEPHPRITVLSRGSEQSPPQTSDSWKMVIPLAQTAIPLF